MWFQFEGRISSVGPPGQRVNSSLNPLCIREEGQQYFASSAAFILFDVFVFRSSTLLRLDAERLPKEGASMGMTRPLELEMAIISFAWGPMYSTKPRFLHQRDASGGMVPSGASRSRCPTRVLVIGARGACLTEWGRCIETAPLRGDPARKGFACCSWCFWRAPDDRRAANPAVAKRTWRHGSHTGVQGSRLSLP